MKVRCCNLFPGDEITSLNQKCERRTCVLEQRGYSLEQAEYSFPGTVTLPTKVTASLRKRKVRE